MDIRRVESGMAAEQVRLIISEAVAGPEYDSTRVLLIVPDLTRNCPVGLVFHALYENLAPRVKRLDILVALGTHQRLPHELICKRLEITPEEYQAHYANKTALYNHEWDDPAMLEVIGVIAPNEVSRISCGMCTDVLNVVLNRRVRQYDRVIVAGTVFPHELAGFSGGNKYFFPGVSAGPVIDTFHWLGARMTNRKINGIARNPMRDLIDRAASMIGVPVLYLNFVLRGGEVCALVPGTDNSAWLATTEIAARETIVYTGKRYARVVCIASQKYDDFWTAAKAVYKAETIVCDGGELIVYAPHVRCFSHTHEAPIRRAGYHPAAWFTQYADRYTDISGTVLAHLALARCEGEYHEYGGFQHRIEVTLATEIDEAACHAVNMAYADWKRINLCTEKKKPDTFVIEDAGDMLYRPAKD